MGLVRFYENMRGRWGHMKGLFYKGEGDKELKSTKELVVTLIGINLYVIVTSIMVGSMIKFFM